MDRLIPVESLAETLRHTLEQTRTLLDELDRRQPVGLRLHRLDNSVKVTADVITTDTLRRSWRAHLGRRSLDSGQGRLIHQVRTGRRPRR